MPWSDQGEPPNKSNDPWGKGNGPWGSGPGEGPPDLEDFLRRSQEGLKQVLPSGIGGRGGAILVLLTLLAWLSWGFYTVNRTKSVSTWSSAATSARRRPASITIWPYPIGSVVKPKVTDRNVDLRRLARWRRPRTRSDVPEESLMLTGDMNIADVKFRVIWQIDPLRPEDYAFNVRNQPTRSRRRRKRDARDRRPHADPELCSRRDARRSSRRRSR